MIKICGLNSSGLEDFHWWSSESKVKRNIVTYKEEIL